MNNVLTRFNAGASFLSSPTFIILGITGDVRVSPSNRDIDQRFVYIKRDTIPRFLNFSVISQYDDSVASLSPVSLFGSGLLSPRYVTNRLKVLLSSRHNRSCQSNWSPAQHIPPPFLRHRRRPRPHASLLGRRPRRKTCLRPPEGRSTTPQQVMFMYM